MWTRLQQQQQRGAQLHARATKPRRQGEAPAEAVAGREAQEHEHAALDVASEVGAAGESPASPIENRRQDNTPSAPADPRVEWDDVVQPERRRHPREAWDDPSQPEDQ